jgi:RHS repeat-associated protein
MGNVVRTTTTAGAKRNEYAYTPYGRSIPATASTLDADDPYRFVGSQGVMQDLPNLYFMRARYYSSDAAIFLSTDPIRQIGPASASSSFLYADLNPFGNVDPQGLTSVQLGGGVGISIAVQGIGAIDLTGAVGLIFESEALAANDDENAMGKYYQLRTKFAFGADKTGIGVTGPFDYKKTNSGYGVQSIEHQSGSFTHVQSAGEKSQQLFELHGDRSAGLRSSNDPPLTSNMNPLDRVILNAAKRINTTVNSISGGAGGSSKSTAPTKASSSAVKAGNYANSLNSQKTQPVPPTISSRNDPPKVKSAGNGGSSNGSSVVGTVAKKVNSIVTKAQSKITSVIKSISSFLGGKKKK